MAHSSKYQLGNQAGLTLEAARWLVEDNQAMLLGADNFGIEAFPSTDAGNYVPVHTYLFAERGVSVIEVMWLEDLARDQVYEFLFIAAPLKLRGATGSPLRPVAPRSGRHSLTPQPPLSGGLRKGAWVTRKFPLIRGMFTLTNKQLGAARVVRLEPNGNRPRRYIRQVAEELNDSERRSSTYRVIRW